MREEGLEFRDGRAQAGGILGGDEVGDGKGLGCAEDLLGGEDAVARRLGGERESVDCLLVQGERRAGVGEEKASSGCVATGAKGKDGKEKGRRKALQENIHFVKLVDGAAEFLLEIADTAVMLSDGLLLCAYIHCIYVCICIYIQHMYGVLTRSRGYLEGARVRS